MDIVYTDRRDYTPAQLQSLFRSVDWISADYPERLKKALDHCETVYTAWCGEKLVGLINAIDDSELTAYVHYLCVDPRFQARHRPGTAETDQGKVQGLSVYYSDSGERTFDKILPAKRI